MTIQLTKDDLCLIDYLTQNFDECHKEFIKSRKWSKCLPKHRKTIKMRQALGIAGAIDSDDFLGSLRSILVCWGRGDNPKLASLHEFKLKFREHKDLVMSLNGRSITELDACADDLWKVIECLGLSNNEKTGSQIVNGSKALHHLLPELLPPIDGKYTGKFFNNNKSKFYQGKHKQEEAFRYILKGFLLIAKNVDLSKYVDFDSNTYATSKSKVLDNAIVGSMDKIKHKIKNNSRAHHDKITLTHAERILCSRIL